MTTKTPVETKVYAGAAGTVTGGVFATFLVWLAGVLIWGASSDAGSATDALSAVPGPVTALVALVVTTAGTVLAAYRAPHTPRS